MSSAIGNVLEIRLTTTGEKTALIGCPEKAIPAPGRYLLAHAPGDENAPLADVLFPMEITSAGFIAAPPIPPSWEVGTTLELRGPLGRGFRTPTGRQLAFVAVGGAVYRLMPLLQQMITDGRDIALFIGVDLPDLPPSVEVHPLASLPELRSWADALIIDTPLEKQPELRQLLGIVDYEYPPSTQVLVHTPMPCGGLADCGICAVSNHRGYKLACKDGPVFDWPTIV